MKRETREKKFVCPVKGGAGHNCYDCLHQMRGTCPEYLKMVERQNNGVINA